MLLKLGLVWTVITAIAKLLVPAAALPVWLTWWVVFAPLLVLTGAFVAAIGGALVVVVMLEG